MSSVSPVTPTPVSTRAAIRNRSTTRQIVVLTVAAIGLYVGIRQLPTGTNLSHLDFRVAGGNSIEFCDPANPQFVPVVAVRSPVIMQLVVDGPTPTTGADVRVVASLATSSGKPIGPSDLLVAHTEKLHLLIFDPELRDYQHVHPTAGAKPGEWSFSFTPHLAGKYRVFADFTPAATARSLYASSDLEVQPSPAAAMIAPAIEAVRPIQPPAEVVKDGIVFRLEPSALPLKARAVTDFQFSVQRVDGAPVRLEPVMDAYAHLVAVDRDRSGFAHLHPAELVPMDGKGATYSKLKFKVTIPQAGRYVIWSQVRVNGREFYAPFWFDVVNG